MTATPNTAALQALLERVEAETVLTGDCLDAFPDRHEHRDEDAGYHAMAAYLGSLDAAKALHEAVLPGWPTKIVDHTQEWLGAHGWNVIVNWPLTLRAGTSRGTNRAFEAWSDMPARAWLIAVLRALIATPDTEGR